MGLVQSPPSYPCNQVRERIGEIALIEMQMRATPIKLATVESRPHDIN